MTRTLLAPDLVEARRSHPRYTANLTIALLFDHVPDRPPLHTVAADASAGGLSLESHYGDLEGATVTVLVVPDIAPRFRGEQTLRFRAQVVWNRQVRGVWRGRRYRHGLRFLGYGSDDGAKIEHWLRGTMATDAGRTSATAQSPTPSVKPAITLVQDEQTVCRARSDALRRAHHFLEDLLLHLDAVRPACAEPMYRIARLPPFERLAWRSGTVFLSTRETAWKEIACTELALRYAIVGAGPMEVELDHPANDALRRTLSEFRMHYSVDDRRNERGMVVSSRFVVDCAIRAAVSFIPWRNGAGFFVRMSNVGGFGQSQLSVSADEIDAAWLGALGAALSGDVHALDRLSGRRGAGAFMSEDARPF